MGEEPASKTGRRSGRPGDSRKDGPSSAPASPGHLELWYPLPPAMDDIQWRFALAPLGEGFGGVPINFGDCKEAL